MCLSVGCYCFRDSFRLIRKEIKKEHKNYNVPASYVRNLCNNYGIGFIIGVDRMFKKQNETTETGIILVTPKEVSEYFQALNKIDFEADKQLEETNSSNYYKYLGYKDGQNFVPNKSLE